MDDNDIFRATLCDICKEDEGSEEHEDHGMICKDCSDSLADIDDNGYSDNIQQQIDAEPEIFCDDE